MNGWKNKADEGFDRWFADDKEAFRQKLDNLTAVLGGMNDGKGPDILALAEVETERAARLLMDSLNERIGDKAPPYRALLMKDPHGGRHIATAILTRLPVERDRTRLLGRGQRILEGHVRVNGHDLVVLATHWTSRVSDKDGEHRARYADTIYGRFRAMYQTNPAVDFLVCGDFNDNPDDPSVTEHLHAVADPAAVRASARGAEPELLDLFGKLWQETRRGGTEGTHYYRGKVFIFDQVVVSPGLLDNEGWGCATDTATIYIDPRMVSLKKHKEGGVVKPVRAPKPFGGPHEKVPLSERGASDHFPVTVRLTVAGGPEH